MNPDFIAPGLVIASQSQDAFQEFAQRLLQNMHFSLARNFSRHVNSRQRMLNE